ncbi:hypothetical protein MY55_16515 [Chromobacterium subtsugae]|nr:hypothetical protein MY55_16515 [Chromobacterium subtsugae]
MGGQSDSTQVMVSARSGPAASSGAMAARQSGRRILGGRRGMGSSLSADGGSGWRPAPAGALLAVSFYNAFRRPAPRH